MHHLPTLAQSIKRKYFPELLTYNTPLEYVESVLNFLTTREDKTYTQRIFYITVDASLGNVEELTLIGGLAYQLAKITSSIVPQRKSLLQKIFGSGPEKVENPDYQKSPEEIVRQRGLGEQLDKFLAYSSMPKNPNQLS